MPQQQSSYKTEMYWRIHIHIALQILDKTRSNKTASPRAATHTHVTCIHMHVYSREKQTGIATTSTSLTIRILFEENGFTGERILSIEMGHVRGENSRCSEKNRK